MSHVEENKLVLLVSSERLDLESKILSQVLGKIDFWIPNLMASLICCMISGCGAATEQILRKDWVASAVQTMLVQTMKSPIVLLICSHPSQKCHTPSVT